MWNEKQHSLYCLCNSIVYTPGHCLYFICHGNIARPVNGLLISLQVHDSPRLYLIAKSDFDTCARKSNNIITVKGTWANGIPLPSHSHTSFEIKCVKLHLPSMFFLWFVSWMLYRAKGINCIFDWEWIASNMQIYWMIVQCPRSMENHQSNVCWQAKIKLNPSLGFASIWAMANSIESVTHDEFNENQQIPRARLFARL